jgi:membrane-associated phospholipid phosphatase
MKPFVVGLLACALACPALCQEPPPQEAPHSTLEVKPGPPAISNRELWDENGLLRPFRRMPQYIWKDQKAIWASPFHTTRADAKWWGIFGAATVALIATDKWTERRLPNTMNQVRVSTATSRLGAVYSIIPLSAGFYFIGSAVHNQRFRETGMLGFEALIDSTLVEVAVKAATDRARPLESDGNGHFWDGSSGPANSSFPSGHAINAWALASVVAHQYPHPRIIPILAYGLASTVVISRVGARKHFPSDVVAGAALGWFIGDFVFGRRHNSGLDRKASVGSKVSRAKVPAVRPGTSSEP